MRPTENTTAAATSTDQAGRALEEYLAAAEAGTAPPREEFLVRHPQLADDLDACLEALRFIGQAAQGPRSLAGIAEVEGSVAGTIGDFRIIREVGRGGMGIVYEAEQISLGRRVALKVLPFAATLDPRQLQRFHNEARAAASLHHEHIVPVFAVGQERGIHFFAMQFIEGQSLAQIIQQQKLPPTIAAHNASTAGSPAGTAPIAGKTSTPPRDAAQFQRIAEWGIQAADALEHAHSLGIVHRDIKPGNLMIDAHGQLWVADFGLARRAADPNLTMSGDLLGTLRYMSPEQALAKHDLVDHRSDVYSLGATLYELLTLQYAVEGKDRQEILRQVTQVDPSNPRQLDRSIPADLETIVLKALAKEPEGRYGTAKELGDDLRRYLAHEPIRARRPSLRQKLANWGRRNRPAVVAATIAAFVITAVLGTAAGISYQAEESRVALDRQKLQTRQDQLSKDMTRALDDVEAQQAVIHAKLADPIKVCELLSNIDGWKDDLAKARADWKHGNDLAASNADVFTPELAERLRLMDERIKTDEADWKLAKELDDIRLQAATMNNGLWNPGAIAKRFDLVFQSQGIPLQENNVPEQAYLIPAKLRYVMVAALDYWATVAIEKVRIPTILAIARAADPDPWRDQVRDPSNWTKREVLRGLAENAHFSRLSPHLALLLASRLWDNKLDSVAFLRASLMHHPSDFWLHFKVAEATENWVNRIGHYYATLSVRPTSSVVHNNLAFCLKREAKDFQGAFRHFRKAIECDPENVVSHFGLSKMLFALNDRTLAAKHLLIASDLADKNATDQTRPQDHTAGYRHVGLVSDQTWTQDHAATHRHVGRALVFQGLNLTKAMQHCQRAIELDRDNPDGHSCLGLALFALLEDGQSSIQRTEVGRAAIRKQVLKWLKEDLTFRTKQIEKKEVAEVAGLVAAIDQWQNGRELANVRGEKNLTRFPTDECLAWREFWVDIEQLRKQFRPMFRDTHVSGSLTAEEGEQAHELNLKASKTYVVDLESLVFDTFLRLEDGRGKKLAENDDIAWGVILNSRLVFQPLTDGVYRFVASPYEPNATGPYTLTVREFVK